MLGKEIKSKKPPVIEGMPWLFKSQIKLVESYLDNNDIMLEFGSGGSTIFFSKIVKSLCSLEHEDKWFDVNKSKYPKNVIPLLVHNNMPGGKDCGEEKSDIPNDEYKSLKAQYPYAFDFSIRRYWQFRDYVNAISKFNVPKFDKVMIDGRARSFCAFKVLPFIDQKSIVFFDNFYSRLKWHSDVLAVYEEVAFDGALAVLKKRSSSN